MIATHLEKNHGHVENATGLVGRRDSSDVRAGGVVLHEADRCFDAAEVQKALEVIVDPGSVFEIRILEPRYAAGGCAPRVISGYFDDPAKVSDALNSLWLDGAKGVYVTLNPVNPALLARSRNKFTKAMNGQTTGDKDITCRRWLLVDIDPKRPAGISASDEEKANGHTKALAIYTHLREAGWPEPHAGANLGNI